MFDKLQCSSNLLKKPKHNGTINGVHKETCESLQINSFQVNKSCMHWEIKKKLPKEFQRLNKSINKNH